MNIVKIDTLNLKNGDTFNIGRKFDHKSTELFFEGLDPNVEYKLLLSMNNKERSVTLVNSRWLVSNTYTQEQGTIFAQLCAYEVNEWIRHGAIFRLTLGKSLGKGDIIEEIPPRFEDKFKEMVTVINDVELRLQNGSFDGYSPTIDIQPNINGTKVTITDKLGVKSFDILNGKSYTESQEFRDLAAQIRADRDAAKTSANNASASAQNASQSATLALNKAQESSNSATASATSASEALQSSKNAQLSETAASTNALNASKSANDARASETNAKTSELAAQDSKVQAKASETAAKTSELSAGASADVAKSSEAKAKSSADLAFQKATAAELSATNAKTSETNAKTSETNAATSAITATNKAKVASDSAAIVSQKATEVANNTATVSQKATEAAQSATNAKSSEAQAKTSETNTKASENNVYTLVTGFDAKVLTANTNLSNKEVALQKALDDKKVAISTNLDTKVAGINTELDNKVATATESAKQAKLSETSAKASEVASKQSETKALDSETKAKQSETNAKLSEDNAQKSANSIKVQETQITQNKEDILKLAIKPSTSGNPCVINDSTDYDLLGLEVYGESTQVQTKGYQLFDASKLPTKSQGGVTVTNNGDGSFTINGGQIGSFYEAYVYTHEETVQLLKAGNITLSCERATYPYFEFSLMSGGSKMIELKNAFNIKETKMITSEMLAKPDVQMGVSCYSNNHPITNATIKPMLYQEGNGTWESFTGGKPSPSPEYPQEIVNKVVSEIEVTGKNLLETKEVEDFVGVNISKKDGYFVLNGTATQSSNYEFGAIKLQKGTYTLSANNPVSFSNPYALIQLYSQSTGINIATKNNVQFGKMTYKLEKDVTDLKYRIRVEGNTTYNNFIIKPQLEIGSITTPYEPYKSQSVKLSQPIALRGLKSEQGNVDIGGVKYISDVICEKNGVYGVERYCSEVVLDGKYNYTSDSNKNYFYTEEVPTNDKISGFCNKAVKANLSSLVKGKFYISTVICVGVDINEIHNANEFKTWITTNPYTVCYGLKSPTFEPLPQADQDAIKQLKSYYPTTIINTNAFTQTQYVADTKLYIDNSIAKYHAQAQANQAQLMSLLPNETQATMIENDQNNLLGGI